MKDLHDAILNLNATPDKTAGANFVLAYKMGHRDARHAAAELAADAPDCTRSHPHENMGQACELRTEIARLNAGWRNANVEALEKSAQQVAVPPQLNGCSPEGVCLGKFGGCYQDSYGHAPSTMTCSKRALQVAVLAAQKGKP